MNNRIDDLTELNANLEVYEFEFNKKKAALYGGGAVAAGAAGAGLYQGSRHYGAARAGTNMTRREAARYATGAVGNDVKRGARGVRSAAANASVASTKEAISTGYGNARQSATRGRRRAQVNVGRRVQAVKGSETYGKVAAKAGSAKNYLAAQKRAVLAKILLRKGKV